MQIEAGRPALEMDNCLMTVATVWGGGNTPSYTTKVLKN
jgi:hypothetical protein